MPRPKKRKQMGRPSHTVTDATKRAVKLMAAAGLWQYEIAEAMGVNEKTLVKYYDLELRTGWADTMTLATGVLVNEMTEGTDKAVDAAKFFLSKRGKGRWNEVKQMEVSGPGGSPIAMRQIDIDVLDIEEQEQLEAMLTAVLSLPAPDEIVIDPDDDEDDDA
jgi:hypothetical protein